MHVFSLGPDEYDPDNLPKDRIWVVYWYEEGYYDGSGIAMIKYLDGTFDWHCMGHCSCYGGWEEYIEAHMTFEEALADLDHNGFPYDDATQLVIAKAKEIESEWEKLSQQVKPTS